MEQQIKTEQQIKREQFTMQFKKAMDSMCLDNLVLKQRAKQTKYTNDQVRKFVNEPSKYQKELRTVVDNLCNAYPQFRGICEYLPDVALINYVLTPNTDKVTEKDYLKNASYVQKLNVKSEFKKCLNYNYKYDVFYGCEIENDDSYFIKVLPYEYCRILGRNNGVYMMEFDFSYFTAREKLVLGDELGRVAYPEEFKQCYLKYKNSQNRELDRWQYLECGIVTKYNETILDYAIPPFIGLFKNLTDIEDMQDLAKSKAVQNVWKLLSMEIPMNEGSGNEDDFLLSMETIEYFNTVMQQNLPDGIGIITSPMKATPITLTSNATATTNDVQDTVQLLFDSAGFSKMLFSDAKNSTALSYSVKVDEARLYGLYRQYEDIVNRKLREKFKGKFKFKILNMSKLSEKDTIDTFIKTAQISVPNKTILTSALGLEPYEVYGLGKLENEILMLSQNWTPLQSSYTSNSQDISEVGANTKDDDQLSEAGIRSRENDVNAD